MVLGQDPLSDDEGQKTPHGNALVAPTIKPTIRPKLEIRAYTGSNRWAGGFAGLLDLQKFSTSALLPRTTHKQESYGLIKHIGTETQSMDIYFPFMD